MSATAFSSNDDVIDRKLGCESQATKSQDLEDVYELIRCQHWIQNGNFTKIALQFPDEMLVDAPQVASRLQAIVPGAYVFILGDTSFGSCCVDEVAAQHYKADCVIHFGRACLSPTARLPVLYVFGRSPLDLDDCVTQILDGFTDRQAKAVLVYDTTFHYIVDELYTRLKQHFSNLVLSQLNLSSSVPCKSSESSSVTSATDGCCQNREMSVGGEAYGCGEKSVSKPEICERSVTSDKDICESSVVSESDKEVCKCGRRIELSEGERIEDYTFLFVGDTSGPGLINLMMTFNQCPFYSYNPRLVTFVKESVNINRALMKRYYLIERVKDASIVGIVAGTLGVARYREMMEHLKTLLKKSGKKSYTFVVGKLNPAKLANFAEIDLYVLVSCPESCLLDMTQFYRPVVSPFEVELALNEAHTWTGQYSMDFRELLPGGTLHIPAPEATPGEERADVSLISNKVRVLGVREEGGRPSGEGQVALKSDMAVAVTADNAAEYFASRSWQGLEQKLGETPVVKATEGTKGIAAGYQHEPGSTS